VLLVLSTIVLALTLYWASGYFFAYTDDAYVTSDLVSVAPYVSGRILSINIADNQTVKKGELLATIDSTPFQLALNEKQAKKTEAEAQLAVDRDVITATQAQRDDAAAKERLASDTAQSYADHSGRVSFPSGARYGHGAGAGSKSRIGRCRSLYRKSPTDADPASGNGRDDHC
jgi:multidrug resistance efflux pump